MSSNDAWQRLRDDLAHSAILTDFDGTLSPVVTDPALARPLPEVADLLERLTAVAHSVAVVSGRPLAFLEAHLGPSVILSGLYGMETRRSGVSSSPEGTARWREIVAETAHAARIELPDDVLVEAKGAALTLHYRRAPHRQSVIESWAADRASRTGLVVAASRCSVELNPPLATGKGAVVAELASAPGVRHACYLGDDRADLDAFEALDALRDHRIDVVTVAVRGAETPLEVLAGADRIVDGPHEAVALLRSLVDPATP